MSDNSKIICQVYEWKKQADVKNPVLIKAQMFECRDERDAENRAQKIHDSKQHAGVDVFKITVAEDLGEYGEPEFIVRLGDVPGLED